MGDLKDVELVLGIEFTKSKVEITYANYMYLLL